MIEMSFGMVIFNKYFLSKLNFASFLVDRNMGMVKPFFITNFLYIYDYMLKKGLNISIFNISTFPMLLCWFLLHQIEIFPKSHDFLNKSFVKHFSTVLSTLS